MGEVIEVVGELEEDYASRYERPILKFGSESCRPCKALAPHLEKLTEEFPECTVLSIDVEKSPETAQRFGVWGIPVVIAAEGFEIKSRLTGASDYRKLRDWYSGSA